MTETYSWLFSDEGNQDLSYTEGDVIEMAKLEPTADVNEIKIRHGKNTRTGETGEFKMDEIHIIPIISKPTTETLVGLRQFF